VLAPLAEKDVVIVGDPQKLADQRDGFVVDGFVLLPRWLGLVIDMPAAKVDELVLARSSAARGRAAGPGLKL